MKKWKALCAGLTLAAAAVFCTGGMLGLYHAEDTEITASAETLTYTESGSCSNGNYGTWYFEVSYNLIEEQYWDDQLGAPVYTDRYIVVTGVTMDIECYCYTGDNYYGGGLYDLKLNIPAEIDGVPVREIGNVSVDGAIEGYAMSSGTLMVRLNVPDSVTKIGNLTMGEDVSGDKVYLYIPSSVTEIGSVSMERGFLSLPSTLTSLGRVSMGSLRSDDGQIRYGGSFAQFAELYPNFSPETGFLKCSDFEFYSVNYNDIFEFSGTSAEWLDICPAGLSEIEVICSDGRATAIPDDDSYIFDLETKTAVYVGNEEADVTYVYIPEKISGYTVVGIAEDALTGYASLTQVDIPATVTEIADHSVGYWKNSDGTYSLMSKVVISCVGGSAAETYAIENGLSYYVLKQPETTTTTTTTVTTTTTTKAAEQTAVPGDLNGNGKMNMMDLVQMCKYLLGEDTLSASGYAAADVTGDKLVNVFDLALMKRLLLTQ
ncbi:MAG: dockerin type I repeat-containing protein [Ruminococcus sp.]|nr:dockerin type I repeat-containing protein [Ruminococcus sp.]